MKVMRVFDPFTGSLSADVACRQAALAEALPDAGLVEYPLADGGDGLQRARSPSSGLGSCAGSLREAVARFAEGKA